MKKPGKPGIWENFVREKSGNPENSNKYIRCTTEKYKPPII